MTTIHTTLRVCCYPDRGNFRTKWTLIGFIGDQWISEEHPGHDEAQVRAVELSGRMAPVTNHCGH